MPAPKKHTQFIFDDIEDTNMAAFYGDLGSQFVIFKKLADTRKQKRMSQHSLADKSGLAQSVIARIESGRANPTLLQLIKLARALDHKISLEPARFDDGDYEGYKE